MFGGSLVRLNPVPFLRRGVQELAASYPMRRSGRRSALGAARSVISIYSVREKNRECCFELYIFP